MSIDSNRALGARFFDEQDRLKGGPEPSLCAPAYVAEIVGFPVFDRAGHEQFAKAFYAAFPDIRHHIQDSVADTDKVAVRVVL